MANITYNRTYTHVDWIDNEDVVQADGEKGFNVQFHAIETEFDNISGVIAQISAGLGAFQPVGVGGAVAYTGGNVGIGSGFSAASPPTYRLEVPLTANSGTAQQVRFGNVVCSSGAGGAFAGHAVFSHKSHASDSNFALRQGPNGDVQINAAAGQPISFLQGGTAVRMGISNAGHVIVGSDADLTSPPIPAGITALLQVTGEAFKLTPGHDAWTIPSDARLKEDVRDLEVGLAELRQVRPVRFRCNGRAGTPVGVAGVGVIGQEIEKIFPEMIRKVPGGVGGEPGLEDLRIYDSSALPYVLVNSVKELAGKVEQLEQALAEAHKERGSDGTSGAEPALTHRSTLLSSKITFPSVAPIARWLRFWLPLFVLLHCGNAWGACHYQDIDILGTGTIEANKCDANTHAAPSAVYDNPGGTSITDQIALCPDPSGTITSVIWTFTASGNCAATSTNVTCSDGGGTMVLTAPSSPGLSPLQFSGTVPTGFGSFSVTATDANNPANNCKRTYSFNSLGTSGGWGDPHITTFDGVHYDFQSAGEFTALRGDGLEIQTRQTPVATTFLPGANPYTGLATCVAVYSAVAARVCDHRVTYQPNISGVPDPSGLQLRVDGQLTTLGPEGIDLKCGPVNSPTPSPGAIANRLTGGRIVKSPAGNGIEIHYSDGTQLVVTPAYWPDQQKWYLNVNVYGTTATEGIFGKLAKDSWLPALPDGTSLGPKPESLHQRYVDLYEKFADTWRVTDTTSLFDYAPGTSTATFTVRSWPRESPKSCAIEGEPSAQPVDVSVAEQACSAIVDQNMKADCVFDVRVTGHTGFAQTYQLTQQLQPGTTETTVKDDKNPTKYGASVTFTATVVQRLSRGGGAPTGTVQFILDGGKVGNPVTLDSNGRASWSTSSLQVGKHQIVGKYIPTGWGGLFVASSSPEKSHAVIAAHDLYWWLIILIIVIFIVLGIWWYLRKK